MVKKKTISPSDVPKVHRDIIVLCTKCPGHKRISGLTLENLRGQLGYYSCTTCSNQFESKADSLFADAETTANVLKEREPLIVQYRLDRALKTIADKDRQIELLNERVTSYERAMQYMGGQQHFRMFRGWPY